MEAIQGIYFLHNVAPCVMHYVGYCAGNKNKQNNTAPIWGSEYIEKEFYKVESAFFEEVR